MRFFRAIIFAIPIAIVMWAGIIYAASVVWGGEIVPIDLMPQTFTGAWSTDGSCKGKYKGIIYPTKLVAPGGVCHFHEVFEYRSDKHTELQSVIVRFSCKSSHLGRITSEEFWILKSPTVLVMVNQDTEKHTYYYRCDPK